MHCRPRTLGQVMVDQQLFPLVPLHSNILRPLRIAVDSVDVGSCVGGTVAPGRVFQKNDLQTPVSLDPLILRTLPGIWRLRAHK